MIPIHAHIYASFLTFHIINLAPLFIESLRNYFLQTCKILPGRQKNHYVIILVENDNNTLLTQNCILFANICILSHFNMQVFLSLFLYMNFSSVHILKLYSATKYAIWDIKICFQKIYLDNKMHIAYV